MSISIAEAKREFVLISPAGWRWLAIATVAAIDGLLLAATGISLSADFLLLHAKGLAAWGALTLIYACLRHNPRLASMTQIVMQAFLFQLVDSVFSYLVLSFRAPLMDREFTRLDAMLGLDWLAWFRWIEQHPWLGTLLVYAYDSVPVQFFVVAAVLPWLGRQRFLSEFCTATMVALLIIVPISGLLPALGAWVHFGVGLTQPFWLADVLAMRAGTMPVLGEHGLQGIIVFPSFHTVLAILLVYAMRWSLFALVASASLNAVMLLSIPTVGSHYFVDLIGGAIVALLAIAVARRIERSGAAAAAARTVS